MFTFALSFFADHLYISLQFSTSLRFSPKEEEGIWKKAFTTKTTDHSYHMCRASLVPRRSLLYLSVTSQLTVESRIDRAENA